jgi:hypothetical protein
LSKSILTMLAKEFVIFTKAVYSHNSKKGKIKNALNWN